MVLLCMDFLGVLVCVLLAVILLLWLVSSEAEIASMVCRGLSWWSPGSHARVTEEKIGLDASDSSRGGVRDSAGRVTAQ